MRNSWWCGLVLLGLALAGRGPVAARAEATPSKFEMSFMLGQKEIKYKEEWKYGKGGVLVWKFEMQDKSRETKEELRLKGAVTSAEGKEFLQVEESGRSSTDAKVKNVISVVREVVGGALVERMARRPNPKELKGPATTEGLGGLPAAAKVTYNADGSRIAQLWYALEANPDKDLADREFTIPAGETGFAPPIGSTPHPIGADAGLLPFFGLSYGTVFVTVKTAPVPGAAAPKSK